MTFEGIDFWLQHHGASDPDGMVLMAGIGSLAPATEAQVLRRLMEFHYVLPVALRGYYAVMPGSNLIACCLRIDFDRTPNPVGAIFDFMKGMAASREAMTAHLRTPPPG